MSAFKRYRDAGIVVLLLAVPFFFLRANMKARGKDNKEPPTLNAIDRVVLRVSAPIEFAASSLARGISNVWESYVYLVDVKADNDRLAYENARLRDEVHRLQQRETENRELKRMLQLKQSTTGDLHRGKTTWVFERARESCRRCGTRIREESFGPPGQERKSYWCPSCQPAPPPP